MYALSALSASAGGLGLTTALQGSFWVRFLRPVGVAARSAVGPQVLVQLSEVSAGFGNDPADVWCLREETASCRRGCGATAALGGQTWSDERRVVVVDEE